MKSANRKGFTLLIVTVISIVAVPVRHGLALEVRDSGGLYLVAMGDTAPTVVGNLLEHYRGRLTLPIKELPPLALDTTLIDKQRGQLAAEWAIEAIRQRYPRVVRERAVVIGITDADMFIEKYNWRFAFSYRQTGAPSQRVAIVSFARMDPKFFGEIPDDDLLMRRLRKMVTKNIGVLYFGLPLSKDPKSVMFGNVMGLEELDVMGEELPIQQRRHPKSAPIPFDL
jgi:predicted Zn-dependent protease